VRKQFGWRRQPGDRRHVAADRSTSPTDQAATPARITDRTPCAGLSRSLHIPATIRLATSTQTTRLTLGIRDTTDSRTLCD
jgi:hypothetical protein